MAFSGKKSFAFLIQLTFKLQMISGVDITLSSNSFNCKSFPKSYPIPVTPSSTTSEKLFHLAEITGTPAAYESIIVPGIPSVKYCVGKSKAK